MKDIITKFAIKLNRYLLEQKIKKLDIEAPKDKTESKSISPHTECECSHDDDEELPVIIEVTLPNEEIVVLKSVDVCSDFVRLQLESMINSGELPEFDVEDVTFDVYIKEPLTREDDE